ncbi:hypothetical protein ACFLIM_31775 [Nonomuraea sp. M3C6]|uniref:DoxX protein n=1 Tax=Nonomuraea marmarensis TaxID=3351344 RepID=A0ABW7AK97_9ACTN
MTKNRRDYARYTLAAIRLFNGAAALLAPRVMLRRLGTDPDLNPAAIYALRLFGIRTVLIGLDLLRLEGDDLEQALRTGVLIHTSDALTAASAGVHRRLPAQAAAMATAISSLNILLALAALPGKPPDKPA